MNYVDCKEHTTALLISNSSKCPWCRIAELEAKLRQREHWNKPDCCVENEQRIAELRRHLDNIKVRSYELGQRELHDMALTALTGKVVGDESA